MGGFVIVSAFIPLGTYTSTRGCPVNPEPVIRLSLIRCETLAQKKAQLDGPQNPLAGCYVNATYVQYLLF